MKRKTVTICTSMRFADRMAEVAESLELERGYVVLTPVTHVLGRDLTEKEKHLLSELHLAKIQMSDAVFVVNVGGYIGDAVKREIEYAEANGKEIMFWEEHRL